MIGKLSLVVGGGELPGLCERAGSTLVFVSVSMLPLSLVEMSVVAEKEVVGEGVGAAVDVGAQFGHRKVLLQQFSGQLLKQLVSFEPKYSPCPLHDSDGVRESGKSTFRSWLLLTEKYCKLLSLLKSGREESLFRCRNLSFGI